MVKYEFFVQSSKGSVVLGLVGFNDPKPLTLALGSPHLLFTAQEKIVNALSSKKTLQLGTDYEFIRSTRICGLKPQPGGYCYRTVPRGVQEAFRQFGVLVEQWGPRKKKSNEFSLRSTLDLKTLDPKPCHFNEGHLRGPLQSPVFPRLRGQGGGSRTIALYNVDP